MDIEDLIRQAFISTRPPSSDLFSTSRTEGAYELLGNVQWEQLSTSSLQHHSASVNFLSAEGFAYFLPAFMLAALSEPGIACSVLSRLSPPKDDPFRPSHAAWWQLLSRQQQLAVISFIEHLQAQGDTFSPTALAALVAAVGANKSFKRTPNGAA